MTYNYFDKEHALSIVSMMLEKTGDKLVVIKPENLDGPLEFIQGDLYYPTFEEKVTWLFYSFNKNHCFLDGNKRASVVLASFFLEINGFDFIVSKFMRRIANFSIYVAEDKIDKEFLLEIITSLLNEDDFSEELKIKIVNRLFN